MRQLLAPGGCSLSAQGAKRDQLGGCWQLWLLAIVAGLQPSPLCLCVQVKQAYPHLALRSQAEWQEGLCSLFNRSGPLVFRDEQTSGLSC